MVLEEQMLEDAMDTGPENEESEGGDDEYISGMSSLNDDEHPDNLTYIDIAIEASANGWDEATEKKVQQLADKLERMPTPEEIAALAE